MFFIVDEVKEDANKLGMFNFVKFEKYDLNFDDFNISVNQISPKTSNDFYLKGNTLYGNLDAEKYTEYEIEFTAVYRWFV